MHEFFVGDTINPDVHEVQTVDDVHSWQLVIDDEQLTQFPLLLK